MPQRKEVLVIEDDLLEVRLLKRQLQRLDGVRFTWAHTLTEGLDYLEKKRFTAVITDLGLPEVSGLGAVEVLRQAAPATPVSYF